VELVFDERKLLTPGVHEVTRKVVMESFGAFQKSDQRPKLFAKLVEYLDALSRAGIGGSVIINGSFVMACIDEPEDIDVVLILAPGWDSKVELRPFEYNLVSKRMVRKVFAVDVFVAEAGSKVETAWIDFFGQVTPKWSRHFGWPKDLRKGILRVVL